MVFTTFTFLVFLAVVFALYWSVRDRRCQNWIIVLCSYVFYGWWDWRFAFLMLATSLLDYGAALALNVQSRNLRKAVLIASMCGNLGMLGFFKYFNFFTDSLRAAAASIGWTFDSITLQVVLPVGISFYTFQTMSYTIDVYRGRLRATRCLIEYLAYVSFFPQLVAGPIERATNLLPQFFKERAFNYTQAVDGCRQILWGCFKKMVIADNLAPLVDAAYGAPHQFTGGALALATVFFAFQIYCDFSGYSDIAIGTARLFGFELMRNFAYPYFSQNIAEFWRRWHISLSSWFKDYVYFPLGGSRVAPLRHASNVMITFLLSGFWHGASWNFVIWGAINGLAILPFALSNSASTARTTDVPGGNSFLPHPATLLKIAGTFCVICFGWVFFRARTFGDAMYILKKIFSDLLDPSKVGTILEFGTKGDLGRILFFVIIVLIAMEWTQRQELHPLRKVARYPQFVRWTVYAACLWACLALGTYQHSKFIYFQF